MIRAQRLRHTVGSRLFVSSGHHSWHGNEKGPLLKIGGVKLTCIFSFTQLGRAAVGGTRDRPSYLRGPILYPVVGRTSAADGPWGAQRIPLNPYGRAKMLAKQPAPSRRACY